MLSLADIARVIHEANRALQAIHADPAVPVAPRWDALDEETQHSVISGIEGVLAGNTPEQSHESWCDFKRAHGWTYGEVKDEQARTHPCLVPYADLAPHHRVKDALFVAIATALS